MATKSWIRLFLVSGLIGLGTGALAYSSVNVPTVAESRPTHVHTTQAAVGDPHELLSAQDRQRLIDGAAALTLPAEITDLHFVVFRENHANILDDVELYLRDHYPELIDETEGANGFMRDGTLIVGVGLEPRQAFAYFGQDVGDITGLTDESRLEAILNAMKDDVKAGDIPAGLLKSAQIVDADSIAQWRHNAAKGDRVAAGIGGAGWAFGLSTLIGTLILVARERKRGRLQAARADYATVMARMSAWCKPCRRWTSAPTR